MKIRILALLLALACAGVAPAFAQGSAASPPLADELAIQALARGEPCMAASRSPTSARRT